uniref:AlNc14C109G6335 protein n=1 Tax=Albugo laibachii Nc14 TaxID=890382 RepID=F0WID4_9STRA|nr:AlNc14C109G6335 [Albugo laibachii Nc14]|eukprot:CCA21015.1 AlNc14C109G6335 [Albugo laibachii Nc14]
MPLGLDGLLYVVVLKDGVSRFCEFISTTVANTMFTVNSLLDWFKRYGVVLLWVSDQGSHYKNEVMKKLRKLLGLQHHFVTAYCPWANGSVEVLNRKLLKAMRSLLSEKRQPIGQWPRFFSLCQSSINHLPSSRIGGVAPLTAFTALPPRDHISVIYQPAGLPGLSSFTEHDINEQQKIHMKNLQQTIDALHKQVSKTAKKKNEAARRRHEQKHGVHTVNIEFGDFDLSGDVTQRDSNVILHWKGPYRVVVTINGWTYDIQELVTPFDIITRHITRFRFFREKYLGVTQDLRDYATYANGGHLVQRFLDCRMNPDTHEWEVLVQWKGLDQAENSWEPARIRLEDVPRLLARWVRDELKVEGMRSYVLTQTSSRSGE